MDSQEAKRILLDLYNGIHPESGDALPDGDVCRSMRVACALHIAIRAIDGVRIGVSEMEKVSRTRRSNPKSGKGSGLRKTQSALGNSGTRWTRNEKQLLLDLYEQGRSYADIGKELRRTEFEIQEKLEILELKNKHH